MDLRQFLDAYSDAFPNLNENNVQITSPETTSYNCIAWAAEDDRRWWWPAPQSYWPPNKPKVNTVDNFLDTFSSLGYEVCDDGEFAHGIEKVVLYASSGIPTHMSRQLPDSGMWTSKLGESHDILHDRPEDLEGPAYGEVVAFLKRSTIQAM